MTIKKYFFITVLVLIMSISLAGFGSNNKAFASSSEQRIVQTYGESELTAKPDLANISIAIQTKSRLADDAVEENARIANKVINALLDFGLSENDIKTGSYMLHSYRDTQKEHPEIGENLFYYQVTNELIVSVTKLNAVGELIDLAVINGANNINHISFELQNPQDLMLQALQIATGQAELKAKAIAQSIGETIQELSSIREEKTGYTPVRFPEAMVQREMAFSAAPTPISPADITIRASVIAEFLLNN